MMNVDTGEKGIGAGPNQAQTAVGPPVELVQALAERRGLTPNVKIHASLPKSQGGLSVRVAAGPDDLTKIRRIKAPLAEQLRRIGVHHFEQIAAWTCDDVRSLSAALDLGLRIYQENWIEQAAKLALKRSATAAVPPDAEKPKIAAIAGSAQVPEAPKPLKELVTCAAAAILARVADRNVRPSETDKEALAVRDRRPLDAPSTSEPPAEPVKPLEQFAKYLSPGVLALEINAALEAIKPRLAKTTASFPENREPDNPAVDVAEVAAPSEAAPPAPADDLSLIRSMPARVAIRLEELGIRRFADVADFDADDVAALSVDCGLGDQINEECWIEQAAILAAGRLTKAALANQRERRMCVVPHPVQPLVQDRGLITELASRSAELIAAEPEQTSSNTSAAALVGLAEAVAQDCSVPHPAPVKPMVTVLEAPKPRKSHVETIAPSGVAAKRLSSLPSRSPEAQPTVATTQIDPSPPSPPKVRRPEPSPQVVEAEVYFKPKVASRLSAMDDAFDASGYDAGSEPGPLEHKLSDPDSLQSKLDKAGAPDDMNADDYAAYHRDIEEASVEIVRNKSGATMRNNASAEAGSVRGDGAQSASVSRFLKALRGH